MNILEKAHKILKQPVCDHCLGRQFGRLLSGYTNKERGSIIRLVAAMSIDKEQKPGLDMSNFSCYRFNILETKKEKEKKCSVCAGLFTQLDKWADKVVKASKKYEFNTFVIGTKLSHEILMKEEDLWERVGIDYCEPIKAEINREVGKLVEKKIKAVCNIKTPDIIFLLDLSSGKIITEVNPLLIYGEYQKLVRGIPQTKWPSGKYKTSVEQIIAKPFMTASHGTGHKFHGLGREDIDARCLAWRPFVLEIVEPRKRKVSLSLGKKISKKVKVKGLRFSSISEVRRIKEIKVDKTYKMLVVCKNVQKKDLKSLSALIGEIKQKTPTRVLHRRADKLRKRKVKKIKTRFINKKRFELTVRGEGGLYVKELVSSDKGRTRPSVSYILNQECVCKDLDVVKIHMK